MVFHFVKATGDGACKCCEGCDGPYDVLCYSASSGNVIRCQYHGHGGYGIDIGSRGSLYYRPLRLALGASTVLVTATASLTTALRSQNGEAHAIQRGSGDSWFHFFAPNPTGAFNSPSGANNLHGKFYYSNEEYRFGWRSSLFSISGTNSFWVSGQWFRKSVFLSPTLHGFCVRVDTSGVSGQVVSLIGKSSLSSVGSNAREYIAENGYYDIGNYVNTPYPTPELLQERVTELYPWNDGSEALRLKTPESARSSWGNDNTISISGHGGYYNGSQDVYRWAGYYTEWPSNTGRSVASAQCNQAGILSATRTNTTYNNWYGPPNYPVVFTDAGGSWHWQTRGEAGGLSSRIPGRSEIYVSRELGRIQFHNQTFIEAMCWDRDGLVTGTEQPDYPIFPIYMEGPACVDSGSKMYCLYGSREIYPSNTPADGIFRRPWTATTPNGSQAYGPFEVAKCAANNQMALMICDMDAVVNRPPTWPQFPQPLLLKYFTNPFGSVTLSDGSVRSKVPYNMFVTGGFLYAMICDDTNPWYFRWICKYRVGVLGLELIWKIEPEHDWQCYHSFCVLGSEVWAALTASDGYVFENPSAWIGYHDDEDPPIEAA